MTHTKKISKFIRFKHFVHLVCFVVSHNLSASCAFGRQNYVEFYAATTGLEVFGALVYKLIRDTS